MLEIDSNKVGDILKQVSQKTLGDILAKQDKQKKTGTTSLHRSLGGKGGDSWDIIIIIIIINNNQAAI